MSSCSDSNLNNRYIFADSLRGLAALWVVLYHIQQGNHINLIVSFIGSWFTNIIFLHGNIGVSIFFVLSGFVMAVTTRNKSFDLKATKNFILRRLVRLSPPYYFSIILVTSILVFKKFFIANNIELPSFSSILAHLFYVQDFFKFPEISVVYWTLCFEIQFYLVFAVLIFILSRNASYYITKNIIVVLITLFGFLWILIPDLSHSLAGLINLNRFFMRFWYAFSAGLLAGWLLDFRGYMAIYARLYFIALLVLGVVNYDLFTIGAALTALVLDFANYSKKINVWLNYRSLNFLGLISYSLYLTHNSIIGLTATILNKVLHDNIFTELLVLILSLCLSIIFAYIMFRYIEKPSIALSKSIKSA